MPDIAPLRGRRDELAQLHSLVDRARVGRSGALVVSGEAGVGKTALLDHLTAQAAPHVRTERIVASQSEMELAYAGLQQLCGNMVDSADRLPAPQQEAIEVAFGLCSAPAPSPFLVGLALLGVLTEAAEDRGLLCVVDDAQWLDQASARALAFAARRLEAEGIALVLAMREADEVFAGLTQMRVEGLGHEDACELLRLAVPGGLDRRVRDQLIAESRGNPLALRELPRAFDLLFQLSGWRDLNPRPLRPERRSGQPAGCSAATLTVVLTEVGGHEQGQPQPSGSAELLGLIEIARGSPAAVSPYSARSNGERLARYGPERD
ncbi:AAA family ATPase [Streptomyces sp. NBC_00154]|uniref:AAA family ATPase n=1 Tax=Streptomyces sp. NBC_00154 TaxID=2975670 RepID=UPI002253E9E8|nr:ATP-binding protein [Streptomyces sp. NBC_00154]MCX5314634.1 ATP-binding protein [Streptomyces sp. NBC_00154]